MLFGNYSLRKRYKPEFREKARSQLLDNDFQKLLFPNLNLESGFVGKFRIRIGVLLSVYDKSSLRYEPFSIPFSADGIGCPYNKINYLPGTGGVDLFPSRLPEKISLRTWFQKSRSASRALWVSWSQETISLASPFFASMGCSVLNFRIFFSLQVLKRR